MKTYSPQRNQNAPKNVLKAQHPIAVALGPGVPEAKTKTTKGREYMKISANIVKITNFYQVEPTRKLIDLFGKKYGDRALQQELLNDLYEKAGEFAYYD